MHTVPFEPERITVSPGAIARAVREYAAEQAHRQSIGAIDASTRELRQGLDGVAASQGRLDLVIARMSVVARLSTRPQSRRAT